MHGQHAVGLEVLEVQRKGLAGEQVNGHRVARKRIDHQHVIALGAFALKLQAGVAQDHFGAGSGVAQVSEFLLGHLDHQGVDVVQAVLVARTPIGDQSTHAHTHHAHFDRALRGLGLHRHASACVRRVVAGGLASALFVGELLAMDDLPVQHAQVTAIGDLVHLERAIEVTRHPVHALVVLQVVLHPHHAQAQHQGQAGHPQRATPRLGPLAMAAQQHRHHHQGAQHQAHRQLIVAVKPIRGDHADKKATQKATHRQHQVIHGQVFTAGLLAGQLAMANHAHDKKGAQVQAHRDGYRPLANAQGGQIRQQAQGQHKQRQPQGAAVPALALKAQNE